MQRKVAMRPSTSVLRTYARDDKMPSPLVIPSVANAVSVVEGPMQRKVAMRPSTSALRTYARDDKEAVILFA